jgi:hypothetical protein
MIDKGAVPLRLRRGGQLGRRGAERWAQLNSHPSRRLGPQTQQGAMFASSFAVHAKSGIGLSAEARKRDIRPAEMAQAIRGMIDTGECPFDLLQLEVGALSHEILDCQVAFARGDVEDIGGKFGFGFR